MLPPQVSPRNTEIVDSIEFILRLRNQIIRGILTIHVKHLEGTESSQT
jgi:hypothetical protein